jgi:hypothetical protein
MLHEYNPDCDIDESILEVGLKKKKRNRMGKIIDLLPVDFFPAIVQILKHFTKLPGPLWGFSWFHR